MKKRALAIVLTGLVLVAFLTGCGALSQSPTTPSSASQERLAPGEASEGGAPPAMATAPSNLDNSGNPAAKAPIPDQKMVIRTGDLNVTVDKVDGAQKAVQDVASQMGGYVVESKTWYQDQSMGATVSIRVPVDKFDQALEKIAGLGLKVNSRATSGGDVTQEHVDLEARLRALRAAEERYLALMKTATTVDDVLKVDQALRENQAEIEQIQGRIDYLERSSAMSTITVSLMPKELEVQVGETGWHFLTVLRSAVQAFVVFLQGAATATIWLLIFGWPVLAIAIGLVVWLRNRRHTKVPGSGGQAPAPGAS